MRHQSIRTPEPRSTSWLEARIERAKSKRIAHGGGAWSLPDAETRTRQPQDGAHTGTAEDADRRTERLPGREPADARMTGGTRSLMRRVMGLNVTAQPATRKPARSTAAPGLHAHVA